MPHVPLDEFLEDYDVNEVHSIQIAAAPDAVMAAVRSLTSREVRLATVLMALRGLPAAVLRPRGRRGRSDRILDAPLLDHFTRGGFVVLADGPDELVLGAVGRFWKLEGEIRRVSRDEFVTFAEPGFAKAVLNLHAQASGGGTVLSTETRVKLTDAEARRTFRRYWRVVMPGSALIRRAWLRAIRKRAERGSVWDERRH
ncbi:MAG TPA: hypothetical protein VF072_01170 [Thermoleophilaceae bacterium]